MADNLWMSFIVDDPNHTILYCSSPDGSNWGSDYQLTSFWAPYTYFESPPTQNSPLAPASAFFNNQIFIAWTGSGNSQVVVCSTPSFTPEWGQWSEQALQNQTPAPTPSEQTWTGQWSQAAPSLAVFNNRLYVAFISTEANQAVLVCSSSDGVNWTGNTNIGQQSPSAPSLAVFNGRLYAAFISTEANQAVLVCSTADGVNWSSDTATGQYSHVTPSLAAYNNRLYVAYVADNGTGNLYVTSSADGANWTGNTKTGQSSSLAPSHAVVPFEASPPVTEFELNPPPPPDIPV